MTAQEVSDHDAMQPKEHHLSDKQWWIYHRSQDPRWTLYWNYCVLVDAIHNGEGKCWTAKVCCEEELVEAIETATGQMVDCLCFIEVIVHRDDSSRELLGLGSRLSAAHQPK